MSASDRLLSETTELTEATYSTNPSLLSAKGEKATLNHPYTKHLNRLKVVFQILSFVNIFISMQHFLLSLSIVIYNFMALQESTLLLQLPVLSTQLAMPSMNLLVQSLIAISIVFTPTVVKLYQLARRNTKISLDWFLLLKISTAAFLAFSITQFLVDLAFYFVIWMVFNPLVANPPFRPYQTTFHAIVTPIYVVFGILRFLGVCLWFLLFIVFWVLSSLLAKRTNAVL